MEWRSICFDWNRARAFLVTAEEGSFSAAARAMGMAQPTIGRQVAALEEELSVTLFERVGQRLQLTEAGLDLVEHVRLMAEAANRLSLAATGRSTALEGVVSLTASEVISVHVLPPIIAHLRATHPGIELELVATNTPSDLQRREADIAIRSFRPTEADLTARKIGESAAHLYASPSYLEELGGISSPTDLNAATFLGFNREPALMQGLNAAMGLSLTPSNFAFLSESQLAQWAMTCAGLGVCIMLAEVGDAEPRVQRVLPEHPGIPVPTWLTTHREVHTNRRIRVVFDLIAELWR
ncbi:MAG: LysR family transcriptional regulator [Bradymonadia bacterium]